MATQQTSTSQKPLPNLTIRPITSEADVVAARAILRTFNIDLGYSLAYQQFDEELASLPGVYANPTGVFLLAWMPGSASTRFEEASAEATQSSEPDRAVACLGVRPLPNHYGPFPHEPCEPGQLSIRDGVKVCEMKRMFCLPELRRKGITGALVDRALEIAKDLGYEEMWLDTFPHMEGAKHIYRTRGFTERPAYNESAHEAPLYFGRKL